MRIRHVIAATAVALASTVAPATAAGTEDPPVITDVLTPEEEAALNAEADPTNKVDMYYQGERVDPAEDWSGADICAEVAEDGTMECFDSNAEANARLADAAPTELARQGAAQALTQRAYNDCPNGWVCLWQNANYTGRRLQWPTYSEAKTRHLDQYSPSFRDKASSAAVMRPQRGVTLYDIRNNLPDPRLILPSGYTIYSDFKKYDYVFGGSWNDKADAIKF